MTRTDTARGWALGGTVFGATMMIILGIFQGIEGIAAIVRDRFFVVTPNYLYEVNTPTWGWIHLCLGIVAVVTGLAVFTGNRWARYVGIGLAALSAIANFFWLPYYPLWGLVLIAMAIWVIWSLASTSLHERDFRYASRGDSYGEPMTESSTESRRWTSTNPPSTSQAGGRHWSDQRAPDSPANMPPPSGMPAPGTTMPGTTMPGTTGTTPPAGGTPQT